MANPTNAFPITELDYHLPEDLIAQQPLAKRDESRLLIVDRQAGAFRDERFPAIEHELRRGDLLILNNTKVVPAKINVRRATGGRLSGLFIAESTPGVWQLMLTGSGRLKVGEELSLADNGDDRVRLTKYAGDGHWTATLLSDDDTPTVLNRVGLTPLPPYIRRKDVAPDADAADRERYQTVYADKPGAVAAPTAGLHFTRALLDALDQNGVMRAFVTLHVGVGTFAPIKVDDLADHDMHQEWFEMPADTIAQIEATRARGGRVVAVGTTSVRVLETWGGGHDTTGMTDLFITPPYDYKIVDALITNFHLPRSTLLALVMAFAGVELTRRAYAHAVAERYRFFSYGDAMFLA